MSLSFAGMGLSMLAMAAGLALPFLSGAMSGLLCHVALLCCPPPAPLLRSCCRRCVCVPARFGESPAGFALQCIQFRQHAFQPAGMTGAIALVGTLSYILCFALGAGPVPGLLVPEITAARIRGASRCACCHGQRGLAVNQELRPLPCAAAAFAMHPPWPGHRCKTAPLRAC